MPTGTFIQKILRQPSQVVSTPPSTGPAANPRLAVLAQGVTAWLRSVGSGKVWDKRASDAGNMMAAPNPFNARAVISKKREGERGENKEARTKKIKPIW